MKKKGIIAISIISGLVVLALILVLSLTGPDNKKDNVNPADEFLASSDAVAGENNSEIEKSMTAAEVAGYYIDESDGWYYKFDLAPKDGYDGSFSAGFDASHQAAGQNPQNGFTAGGSWKLENGEIKLYSEGQYRSSMWACSGYIVDSLNYFVGDIDPDAKTWQSVFVSRAGESGDTQIFNLYSDGKLIMEIVRNDGTADSSATSNEQNPLPEYQMLAGTYEKSGDKLIITVGGSAQEYYIVNDGFAKWKYIKKQ